MSLRLALRAYIHTPFPVPILYFMLQVEDVSSKLPTLAAMSETSCQAIFMVIMYLM